MTDALRDAELLARAIASGLGADDAALSRALADYQQTRDRLSRPMFEVVEQLASMSWDRTRIQQLLRTLASTMVEEVETLEALDPWPAPVSARGRPHEDRGGMSTSMTAIGRVAQPPVSTPVDAAAPGRGRRGRGHRRSELLASVREMLPFVVGYVPFALLVGVTVARSADPLAGWAATLPLYGGSAQLTLLELMAGGAAVWAAAGAALLVNTRLLVYSAALVPLFGTASVRTRLLAAAFVVDPTWLVAMRRAWAP